MQTREEEKSILIKERAFVPAPIPTADPNWCSRLYEGEPPEYGEALSQGTVKDWEEFTSEEKIILGRLNHQFSLLLQNIKKQCLELGIEQNVLENIETFNARYTSRVHYPDQKPIFYAQIKLSLEAIRFYLSNNSLLNTVEKKRIMQDLMEEIASCKEDIFEHIQIARNNLSTHETIEAWLAQFRALLIKQATDDYAKRYVLPEGNKIPTERALLEYADTQEWAPWGAEIRLEVDLCETSVAIGPATSKDFRKYFLERYNPLAIMTALAIRLHDSITKSLQKKRREQQANDEKEDGIVIRSRKEFKEFFSGIPLNEKGLTLTDVFDETEDENIASFRYEKLWSLKSVPQLMLSMTAAFARERTNIFETYQDNYYTLVPGFSDLCHQHSKETPPSEAAEQVIHWIKEHANGHFNSPLFNSLYNSGIRDFSTSTLFEVDFSQCVIEELILDKTSVLIHSKITPKQFIVLFKKNIKLLAFQDVGDGLLPDCNEEFLEEQTDEDRAILFFYAVFLNNLPLSELLSKRNVDISKKDNLGQTAIAYAINFNRLQCVIKLIEKKEKNAEASPYWKEIRNFILTCQTPILLEYCSGLLPYAARDSQQDVMEKLLKHFPNIINVCSPEGFTALHYAAREGHREMVQFLLDNQADDTLRAEKEDPKTTPLAYAASHGKWECVELLIPQKSRTIQGYIVLLAAKDNQHDRVKSLTRTKVIIDINICIDDKTALYYAVQHAVEYKDEENAEEHKAEENVEEHKDEKHVAKHNPVDMVRSLLLAGARDDFSKLINIALEKDKIELAILLLTQDIKDKKPHPLVGELHQLTETYDFSPEIKKYFLNFYSALKHDTTSDETKRAILQHLIDILKSNGANGKEEEKDQDRAQKNRLILQKILNSEQDLKNKLNGKPPMSLPLKIALGALFGGIATLLVGSAAIYIVGVAGIEIGSLILPCFISSLITSVPVSCFGYFRHKKYSEKETQNNEVVDAMLGHFRPLLPS
ncbi:MAG: serine/threonine-protein phosphatase 6 regulatory ankyrin repeat subunit B-like [Gammaproteobacteria bacterium]|jgi:ankyrin repeat protein|nr:serine/threonine-protein phosphatase 6 regulatory ankyrin repeat subunit B-like [Gammaproteobacteria bacterium]